MNQVTMTLLALLFSINGLAATETISRSQKTVNLTVDANNSSCVRTSSIGYVGTINIIDTVSLRRTPTQETVFPHAVISVQTYAQQFSGDLGDQLRGDWGMNLPPSVNNPEDSELCALYREVVAQSQAGQAMATMTVELIMHRWPRQQQCQQYIEEKVALTFSNGLTLQSSDSRPLAPTTSEHCQ